jgi:hypothetical protein
VTGAADWTAPSPRPARSSARRVPAPGAMSDVEQLLAYEQIRQLAARYALAINQRDFAALVDLFVEDVRAREGRSGRGALEEDFAAQVRQTAVDILEVTTHVINLTDRTHATGTVYSRCELGDQVRWERQSIAYEDEYECRDRTWYFVRRNHLLFYGQDAGGSPLDQDPARWPHRTTGRGTVPYDWPSWQGYQAAAAAR